MMKRHALWVAVAATALVACGGGSDSSPAPTPAPAPAPGPAPAPIPVVGDRIEPLDTALLPRSASFKVSKAATRQVPAGVPVARVELGPLLVTKSAPPQAKGTALKIGEGREIPATAHAADLAALLNWSATADGGQVAAIAFSAEGARGIRLGVLVHSLPDGATLRFYGVDDAVVEMSSSQVANLRRNNEAGAVPGDDARMVWGPDTAGSVSTLEVQLPPGAKPGALQVAVPRLSHLTMTATQAWTPQKSVANIGDSESCNLDVMCRPDLQDESRSVAKMIYTKRDGVAYMCTGTLLNDAASSRTPYFLTAAHCISDSYSAGSLVTYWFFHAASCNSTPRYASEVMRIEGGADFLWTDEVIDTTLLRLSGPPPANVVYAGSYFGSGVVPGLEVTGIHHPAGDLQKYSVGQALGYATCVGGTCSQADVTSGGSLRVSWQSGTTQGGSSGSALFARSGNAHYVVGTLFGGNASCQNASGSDYYGRFEKSFAAGINQWLIGQ